VNGEPASLPGRQIRVRRTLGTLIVPLLACTALLLGGCGSSSSSSVATAPGSDPAGNPSWTPGPIPGAHVLPLISMTGGGGVVSPVASVLTSPTDLRRFLAQLRVPALQNRVRAAVRPALDDPDHVVVAQVVAVGCDRPPGVGVIAGRDGRVQLVPQEVASPLEECLAAVTTVAVAVLPID